MRIFLQDATCQPSEADEGDKSKHSVISFYSPNSGKAEEFRPTRKEYRITALALSWLAPKMEIGGVEFGRGRQPLKIIYGDDIPPPMDQAF